jgi:hypothetical protein
VDALVFAAGHGHPLVHHLEHGVAGHEGGGVPIRSNAEMGQVERPVRELLGVALGGGLQVVVVHGHGPDAALGADREALDQMCQVALVRAGRGDALIDLEDRRLVPVGEEVLQLGEHRPGVAAAADGQRARASLRDRRLGRVRDQLGAPSMDGLGIVEDLEPVSTHDGFSLCPPNW